MNRTNLILSLGLLAAIVFLAIAIPNIRVMEKQVRQEEARAGLEAIYAAAQKQKQLRQTYAVGNIAELGLAIPGKRYSFWYATYGLPTMIPGANHYKSACDVTTPPTSVLPFVSADRFVAVAKGNIDVDGTCDEWSINQAGQLMNNLDDIRKGWAKWWPWISE